MGRDRGVRWPSPFAIASCRRYLRGAAVIAVACAVCGCGGTEDRTSTSGSRPIVHRPEPQAGAQARAVVQAYLDAVARGDGEAACRLLSPSMPGRTPTPATTTFRSGATATAGCSRPREVAAALCVAREP